MFRLNPYAHSHTNQNVSITLQVLHSLQQEMSDSQKKRVEASLFSQPEQTNDETPQLRFPVFLNRNKRLMKQMRKDLELESGELTVRNGLVMRQVPHIKKLYF